MDPLAVGGRKACGGGATWAAGGRVDEQAIGFLGVSRSGWQLCVEEPGVKLQPLKGRFDWNPGRYECGSDKRAKDTPGAAAEREREPKRQRTPESLDLAAARNRKCRRLRQDVTPGGASKAVMFV